MIVNTATTIATTLVITGTAPRPRRLSAIWTPATTVGGKPALATPPATEEERRGVAARSVEVRPDRRHAHTAMTVITNAAVAAVPTPTTTASTETPGSGSIVRARPIGVSGEAKMRDESGRHRGGRGEEDRRQHGGGELPTTAHAESSERRPVDCVGIALAHEGLGEDAGPGQGDEHGGGGEGDRLWPDAASDRLIEVVEVYSAPRLSADAGDVHAKLLGVGPERGA